MSSTVRHLFVLLVHVLTFSALVAALTLHAGINITKIPPRWFRDRLQKHPVLGESTQVPTFFQRRNKDGKTVNAFEEGAWCKIRTQNSGKDTNTNFASRTSRITINIVWSFTAIKPDMEMAICKLYSEIRQYFLAHSDTKYFHKVLYINVFLFEI